MVALYTPSTIIKNALSIVDGANAPTWEQAMQMAGEFGYHAALGDDSRPNLGRTACAMAKAGTITAGKVDGAGRPDPKAKRDAAAWLFAKYEETRVAKGAHPAKDASRAAQESKLRTFVKVGMIDGVDGPSVLDRAKELYTKDCGKSAYDAYVSVCRAQIDKVKAGDVSDLTDDEITAAMAGEEREPKTIAERLRTHLKGLTKTWEDCDNADVKFAIEGVIHRVEDAIKAAEAANV